MKIQELAHMANQIGAFFASFPDQAEAKKGIADHIHKFWEPRMRTQLLDAMDQPSTSELSSLVREALNEYKASLLLVLK